MGQRTPVAPDGSRRMILRLRGRGIHLKRDRVDRAAGRAEAPRVHVGQRPAATLRSNAMMKFPPSCMAVPGSSPIVPPKTENSEPAGMLLAETLWARITI